MSLIVIFGIIVFLFLEVSAACFGYAASPIITMSLILLTALSFFVFSVLTDTYSCDDEPVKERRKEMRLGVMVTAFLFVPPFLCFILCHFFCGESASGNITLPMQLSIERSVNKEAPVAMTYIAYTDKHMGTPSGVSVDMPSDAHLSSGTATFKPMSIIEYNGFLSGLANWISDRRKLGVEVTQDGKTFPMVISVRGWKDLRDNARSPQEEANQEAWESQKKQKADDMLKTSLSSGRPLP